MSADDPLDETLREVKTRRDRVLRFEGETEDGCLVTWFVAYRGKYGWAACRRTGEWLDEPTDDEVRAGVREYDRVDVVARSDVPEVVDI